MLSFKFDSIGSKKVKWPATDVAVIETARKLISAESSLPDSLCFPRLNLLRHTLANAENAVGVLAIDDSGDLLDEDAACAMAEDFSRIITAGLSYFHAHELEGLVDWGIPVFDGRPQAPSAKPAMIDMLQKYVEKENSLPGADRLPSPPLAQVAAVCSTLLTAQKNREQARDKKSAKGRAPEVQLLSDLLQLAAGFHVVIDFDGVVDERLEQLGFDIIDIPVKKTKQPAPQPAEPEQTDASEPAEQPDQPDSVEPIVSESIAGDIPSE